MDALHQTLTANPALLRTVHPNLVLAWLWIMLGFFSGAILGLNFQKETWLGGYGSLQRRLYRLAHISFFGLALINLLFYFTVGAVGLTGNGIAMASWGFRIGAITMPVCCILMAHFPKTQPLFVLPVGSLMLAGFLTLLKVMGL